MFATHQLDGQCKFLVGRLPDALIWDNHVFEAVWRLHPADKHVIMMHGRPVPTPRWQQAYGVDYYYTGGVNRALPMPPELDPLVQWVQPAIDPRLNGALLNWYDGPGHYIGPHHDSTRNMVSGSPIITVSLGETRVFRLTRGKGPRAEVKDFPATHGAAFVMPWETNKLWKHGVPKSARYTGRRISVTFRAFAAGHLA
jgi:alkylated DNA repair dioxygenase AlkB